MIGMKPEGGAPGILYLIPKAIASLDFNILSFKPRFLVG
jgi:hypothetical protein